MEFIEYPKALYRAGVHLEVCDADAEFAARGEGYDDWVADQAVQTSAPDPSALQKHAGASKSSKKVEDL